MEALQLQLQGHVFSLRPVAQFQPDTDKIKRNLIQKGVNPTPKIIHTLRKKHIQKHNRKLNRQAQQQSPQLSNSQKQTLAEEQHFQELKHEYKQFTKALEANAEENEGLRLPMAGKPWEGIQKVEFLERTKANKEYRGEKLKRESLKELGEMFRARKMDDLKWVFHDDLEINELSCDESSYSVGKHTRKRSEAQVIRFLVDRFVFNFLG